MTQSFLVLISQYPTPTFLQLSIHEQPDSDAYLMVMKGAPERILDACCSYLAPDGNVSHQL